MIKDISLKDIYSIAIPVVFGVLSLITWRYYPNLGTTNNSWIERNSFTVFVIVLFTSCSLLNSFLIWKRCSFVVYLLCISLAYSTSIIGFFISKKLFILLYDKAVYESHVLYVWMLIIVVGLVSLSFYLIINYFIKSLRPFHIFTFIAVFISVVPASLITVDWFPDHGGMKTFINSVKLGYPMFWINLLLGWTTYALTKRMI
jgi:hypothetical protein